MIVEEFLDSTPGWMILTTLDPDGQPHSVPMGYFREELDIYMGCRPNTRKVRNLRRDPRCTLLLESGRPGLVGVMLQGRAELIEDPARMLEIKRRLAQRRGQPEPQAAPAGICYIRVTAHKVISWDRS